MGRGLAMEGLPMMHNQTRLNLAVEVLGQMLLIREFAEVAIDLLSKVVNYCGPHIRKLQAFVLAERQTYIRP